MTCAMLRISVPLSRSGLRGTRSGFITVRALDRRASGDSPRGVRPELVILQHLHHGARVSFSPITLSRVHLHCVAPYDWAGRSVKTTAAELEMSLYSALHLEPGISILPGERYAVWPPDPVSSVQSSCLLRRDLETYCAVFSVSMSNLSSYISNAWSYRC